MQKLSFKPAYVIPALTVALIGASGLTAHLKYSNDKESRNASKTGQAAAIDFYHQKEYGQAATLLEREIESKPEDPSGYNVLANVKRDQGDTEAAIVNYNKAIEASDHYLLPYVNLTNLYLNAGNKTEALATMNRGLAVFPENKALLELKIAISG